MGRDWLRDLKVTFGEIPGALSKGQFLLCEQSVCDPLVIYTTD